MTDYRHAEHSDDPQHYTSIVVTIDDAKKHSGFFVSYHKDWIKPEL
jgi:hypothetical protein